MCIHRILYRLGGSWGWRNVQRRHLDDRRRGGGDGGPGREPRELARLLGDRGLGPAGAVRVRVQEALHLSSRRSRRAIGGATTYYYLLLLTTTYFYLLTT